MNIIYLDYRPFSYFVHNGFRQRAGRILYHLLRSNRVDAFVYVWWNEEAFAKVQDKIPHSVERRNTLIHEAKRPPIPFVKRFGFASHWIDGYRISKTAACCRKLTSQPFWVWATDPRLAVPARELANRLNGKLCIDLIDNFATRHEGRQKKIFEKAYEDTNRLADKIFANNPEIQNFANIPNTKFRCVLSGVDWQVFHDGMDLPDPSDMKNIPRPRAGFVGTLSALNDVSFINAVAQEVPECELIIVGPTEGVNQPLHPRIHALGAKPYNEVPAYISSFDVGLSIYWSHPSTQYGDSQKVKEYLAAGKPVVASYAANMRTQSPYIFAAHTVDEFVHMVREAVSQPMNANLREQISLSVADQDWKIRIAEMLDFLEDNSTP